jgi:hypothetical protein
MIVKIAAGAIAVTLLSTPAFAAGQAQYQITGILAQTCSVSAPVNQTIDPTSLAVQATGSISYQCDFIGDASLRLWSQNGGLITSPAAPQNGNAIQSRVYDLTFDGTPLGQLTNASATAASNVRAITAANTTQLGATSIQLASAANVAGSYSDTIFVDITP